MHVFPTLEALIQFAIEQSASDLILEPFQDKMHIKMRCKGEILSVIQVPLQLGVQWLSQVKIQSELDVAEKRLPQDGKMSFRNKNDGQPVELRVATMATALGETLTLRLHSLQQQLTLDQISTQTSVITEIKNLLAKPHGLILVTGPTGSGKTTTLYAMMESLRDSSRKLLSVEDPVECELPGVVQVSVDNKVGRNFPAVLRSFLRHDPDVILIGEIRDPETAKVALQAAMTGHLVLSALHTADAASTMNRLQNLGVEPYLIKATLLAIISQRLIQSQTHNGTVYSAQLSLTLRN